MRLRPPPARRLILAACGLSLLTVTAGLGREWLSGIQWQTPPIIEPGPTDDGPPSDAVVLFDGNDLSQWEGGEKWLVENGYAVARGGNIRTKQRFGDCQLHVEWATPAEVKGSGQGRGNSGVFLMDRYEVQVLDSYDNETYVDGQAGALYKTKPPMVNASRGPGKWQSFDIIFEAPRFDKNGELTRPAYITVLHNGVVIQNHTELLGETTYDAPPTYDPPPSAKEPIRLQFHGNPVRFRNIWIREINEPVGRRVRAPYYRDAAARPADALQPVNVSG